MMRKIGLFVMLTAMLLAALLGGGELGLAAPQAGKGGRAKVALSVSIDPIGVLEGAEASATVTHNNPDVSAAVYVSLTSSDTTEATVPDTVTILAGSNSVTFPITALNDSVTDGD